jgi:essential nuclear protein 1
MGKSKKKNKINTSFNYMSGGLEDQINEGRVAKSKNMKKEKIRLRFEENESEYIDPKTTQRILKAAQKQRAELAAEFGPTPSEAKSRGLYNSKNAPNAGSDSDESDSEQFEDDGKDVYTENDFFDHLKINDDDEKALQMFQNK